LGTASIAVAQLMFILLHGRDLVENVDKFQSDEQVKMAKLKLCRAKHKVLQY